VHGVQEGLQQTKVLIVGVGGIGCEILKVLVKMPLGEVHILDMDTIEVSPTRSRSLTSTASFYSRPSTRGCPSPLWQGKAC
jgi:molybdopterin/thiamine biosynthesis adenylyltransferase